jgi:predicted nuclease of predicted toxin-antitoxin system
MKLAECAFAECAFLADENLHPLVVAYLRGKGMTVRDVKEGNERGISDSELLRQAFERSEVILTHDSDFGRLALAQQQPFRAIVYLRPGHIDPRVTCQLVDLLLAQDLDAAPHMVVVLERKADSVRIRVRRSE